MWNMCCVMAWAALVVEPEYLLVYVHGMCSVNMQYCLAATV
jgi:hypothetical protein